MPDSAKEYPTQRAALELPDGEILTIPTSCTIGRHPKNHVPLDSPTVSRWHASIMRLPNGDYCVMDVGTKNGTRLNGRRISQPSRLGNGSVISVGSVKLRFIGDDPISASATDWVDSTISDGARISSGGDGSFETLGHGILIVEKGRKIVTMTDAARNWLASYFPLARKDDALLPVELHEWLETADGVPEVLRELPSFVVDHGKRRLVATVQADSAPGKIVLMLSEEQPLFDGESLAQDMPRDFQMTVKEAEVTYYVALGKTSAEIGIILGNSERTIHKHLQRIYAKLGLENRKAVIVFIYEYYKRKRRESA